MNNVKINRNDPCPCGSGKKYKQCCQATLEAKKIDPKIRLLETIPDLFKQALKNQNSSHLEDAEKAYQQILVINPKHVDALHNLGLLVAKTGRTEMAVELLRKAARLEPSAHHYASLAQVLNRHGLDEEAMDYLKKAIALNPGDSNAYNNLGTMLWSQHRYGEAIPYYEKSIALDGKQYLAIGNLAICLMRLGKTQEAIKYFRHAININPNEDLTYNNLLMCLCLDSTAFPTAYLKEAKRLDAVLSARATPYQQWPNTTQIASSRPLRIGLVSGDLKNHPVGYFLESVITALDKQKIELVAYNTQLFEDDLSSRIKPHFYQWTTIHTLNDKQAAQKIHDDQIDILIDLAGHTANNRLSLFAWKPAPIQVSWLGYFASTGMHFMDYFLADPISVTSSNTSHFTEKVWYLPETRLCFTPPASNVEQELSYPPVIKNGYITFGCFQNLSKVNDKILKLWAQILAQCPNSKLLVKSHQFKDEHAKKAFTNQLMVCALPIERVLFELGSSRTSYLTSYNSVDIILDTSPYPGGTTTCEALWMGVPTLTLTGDTLLERQGQSMLNCVGLTDWITHNEQEYVQKAISHAQNIPRLKEIRQHLRTTMQVSPLVNAPLFAKNLEAAFFGMWQEKTRSFS